MIFLTGVYPPFVVFYFILLYILTKTHTHKPPKNKFMALTKAYKKKYGVHYPAGYKPLKLRKITNNYVIKVYAILCSYIKKTEKDKYYYLSAFDAFRAMKKMGLKEHDFFSMIHMYRVFTKCVFNGVFVGFQTDKTYYAHFMNIYELNVAKGTKGFIELKGEIK